MCKGLRSTNRKCQDSNRLHTLLINQGCSLIPWPGLACQTQTTARDYTKAQGLTNARVRISLQLPWLCLHILERRGFCNLQKRRDSLMCLWPKTDGVKSVPSNSTKKSGSTGGEPLHLSMSALRKFPLHWPSRMEQRGENHQVRNTIYDFWRTDEINWGALSEQSSRNQEFVVS